MTLYQKLNIIKFKLKNEAIDGALTILSTQNMKKDNSYFLIQGNKRLTQVLENEPI